MKFETYKCECGYNLVTSENSPKCPDCGLQMIVMDRKSEDYKKFDKELRSLF